jgi:hypothetical protein
MGIRIRISVAAPGGALKGVAMIEESIQPGRRMYLLAALILVFGCMLGGVLLYMGWRDLQQLQWEPPPPGEVTYDLTQVVVPGEHDLELDKAGLYTIYYEYNSVVDGVEYATGEQFPGLECSLTGLRGSSIELAPFPGSNTYAFDDLEGIAIWTFTVALPGTYTLDCHYPPGTQEPEIVLAVGIGFEQEVARELLGDLFKTAAPSTRTLILGAAAICGSTALALLIAVVTLIRRLKARAELRRRFHIDQ